MGVWFQTITDHKYLKIAKTYRRLGIKKGLYAYIRLALCPLISIEASLPKKGKIVDVGCGGGLLLQWLALGSSEKDLHLTGIDIDSSRIEFGRKVCMDMNLSGRINLKTGYFGSDINFSEISAVTFIDVLHHMDFDMQKNIISNSIKCLADGGIILIKDVDTRPFPKYLYNYLFDAMTHLTKITKGKVGFYRSLNGWTYFLRTFGYGAHIN